MQRLDTLNAIRAIRLRVESPSIVFFSRLDAYQCEKNAPARDFDLTKMNTIYFAVTRLYHLSERADFACRKFNTPRLRQVCLVSRPSERMQAVVRCTLCAVCLWSNVAHRPAAHRKQTACFLSLFPEIYSARRARIPKYLIVLTKLIGLRYIEANTLVTKQVHRKANRNNPPPSS